MNIFQRFAGLISFNPRVPRGTRPRHLVMRSPHLSFNPRVPRGTRRRYNYAYVEVASFNPRVPRGTRHEKKAQHAIDFGFQSTRPARDATRTLCEGREDHSVSIHASREGRD